MDRPADNQPGPLPALSPCSTHSASYVESFAPSTTTLHPPLPPFIGPARYAQVRAALRQSTSKAVTNSLSIVRLTGANREPVLSGVGISGESEIRAASDPSISYIHNFDALELHVIFRAEDPLIYIFHDACWQLLISRLIDVEGADADSRALRVAKVLFHLLRCLPKDRHGALRIQHDYGGAAKYLWHYAYARGGYERSLSESTRFLMANPGCDATREIEASLANLAETWKLTQNHAPTDMGRSAMLGSHLDSGKDPLGRLPPEVIHISCIDLSTTDLCSLRLASRAVANITLVDRLSQSFWESRFADGFEMEFFFAGRQPPVDRRDINWRDLYLVINRCLAEGSLREGLRNRKRIWACLSYFRSSLEPVLRGNGIFGPIAMTIPPPLWSSIPEELSSGEIAQSHARHEYRAFLIPFHTLSENTSATLSASFIWFNRRRYICGLRLRSDKGGSTKAAVYTAGHIIPESEEHLEFPLHEATSLNVYLAVDGIVGLQFHCRGERRLALGHCSVSHGDVAVAALSPGTSSHICGLITRLDVRNYQIPVLNHLLTCCAGVQSHRSSNTRRKDQH